jgi:hypothetical protein
MTLRSFMTAMPKTGSSVATLAGVVIGLVSAAIMSPSVVALEYTVQNHSLELATRARIAHVETNAKTDAESQDNARAASLLLRLRATSVWTPQFFTLFELDHVMLGWQNEFSNGQHFNAKPVIPDVAGLDLNQALLHYTPTNTLQLTLGREAINLGNERFVGTNGFWQNEQTLDSAGFNFEFAHASQISYRYVNNANRITGQNAGENLSPVDANFTANNGLRPAAFLGDHTHDTHLLFAQFKEWDFSRLHAYYFNIDITEAKALSNQTLGLRYEYKGRWNKLRTLAHGELALQQRTHINNDAMLQFYDLGAGFGYGASEISINYQRLGANNGTSFVTPLASLHDHNGWSDKFLTTPNTGLRDYKLHYIWRQSPLKIDARYHVFNSDENGSKIADELDVDIILKLSRHNTVLLRYADFNANADNFTDEQRVFLMYTHDL